LNFQFLSQKHSQTDPEFEIHNRQKLAFAPAFFLILFSLTALVISTIAFWPGYLEFDSFHQYGQASGVFAIEDWHPISMTLLWRALLFIHNGPQPMLILQMILYWGGFLYPALRLLRSRSKLLPALCVLATGFLPFFLNFSGVIWKDTQMAVFLFWGALLATSRSISRIKLTISLICIFYALSVRYNGAAAALPILLLWSERLCFLVKLKNWIFIPVFTAMSFALYFALSTFFHTLIRYEKTSPLMAQMLNEVVFIECEASPRNVDSLNTFFGEALSREDLNRRQTILCDQISLLAEQRDTNEIYDVKFLNSSAINDAHMPSLWFRSVSSHPLLYLEYRFKVFKTFLRPYEYREPYYTYLDGKDKSPWRFPVSFPENTSSLKKALVRYLVVSSQVLDIFFRPFFWLIALIASSVFYFYRRFYIQFLLSLSGLFYLLGYILFLPAPDFRYAYYSIFALFFAFCSYMEVRTGNHKNYQYLRN